MLEITPDLIERIHRDAIEYGKNEELSLRDTIRDDGCLPVICFGGEHITDPLEKAAYYLHRIATRHPFVEGNKRTAFMVAALVIYEDTSTMIENDNDDNNMFVRRVASGEVDEEEIVKWLKEHLIHSKI